MNALAQESSPYLLQHKDNPVHWMPWNNATLQKAVDENKMLLISIGYSACHWCHVMEHEVFEDFECAELMNAHFICIKVDREERPDVDSVYMDALHLMGLQGGWPLNVFALPGALPVYGGTYFPKKSWLNILENLIHLYTTEPQKMKEYAAQLQQGLAQLNIISTTEEAQNFDVDFLDEIVEHWSQYWDDVHGGARKAPKFPMPNNWEFLLHYSASCGYREGLDHVHLTLRKMALGGIYDQIGGGFSRYSVDAIWKVPHFEKMLYDNAQLITLYAKAYRHNKDDVYAKVVAQTTQWLRREMLSDEGLYYAALDADSEGVEGKFYTWNSTALKEILGTDYNLMAQYFCIDKEALWEHDQNILLRTMPDEDVANSNGVTEQELQLKVSDAENKLLQKRAERIRPGLDNKCITSWNAMLVHAFCEAHKSFPAENYLQLAQELAANIYTHLCLGKNECVHVRTAGKSVVDGFLEDYAFVAESFITLYEVSGQEQWLAYAEALVAKSNELFYDASDGLFFFTSAAQSPLIARKKELQDNVMPASNSAMCKVLYKLYVHTQNDIYLSSSQRMLANLRPMIDFASGYSNWLHTYFIMSTAHYDIVCTGPYAMEWATQLRSHFIPNSTIVASTKESSLPMFLNRVGTNSAIYVCTAQHCLAPMHSVEEVLSVVIKK
jgi:uncharacterized protein